MLVPPRPWRATKDGAYLILPGLKNIWDIPKRYDFKKCHVSNSYDHPF